jgi:hypothetical protein
VTSPVSDPARARFMLITLMRLSGIVLMLFGMGIMATGLVEPRDLVGGAIFLMGAIDALIVPRLLIRKWRTPPAP